jgi:hypothetical protein
VRYLLQELRLFYDGCFVFRAGPSDYQGLLNALKRKIDDSAEETKDRFEKMQHAHQIGASSLIAEIESLKEENFKHQQETKTLMQETRTLNQQLVEALKILHSKH